VFAGRNPDGEALLTRVPTGCVLHDSTARRCELQHALGHAALPLACRQFPRITVHDPRGVAVTLSHYCPTAAALLEVDALVSIVTNAPGFPDDGEYVGLDARDVLPPLLCDGILMDWEAWWELERQAVELLGNWTAAPADALVRLAGAVRHIQRWRPASGGPLIGAVRDSLARSSMGAPTLLTSAAELLAELEPAIPAEVRAQLPRVPRPADRVINRFLAAHAFASWHAYSRHGISGWLRSIERAHALVESGIGIREADRGLRHSAIELSG
jgi:hypothetical protein